MQKAGNRGEICEFRTDVLEIVRCFANGERRAAIFAMCVLVPERNAASPGTKSVCHSLPGKEAEIVCEPGGSARASASKSGRMPGLVMLMESPCPEVETEKVEGALESEDT